MIKYCRKNCIFLNPTEKQQTDKKEKHFCCLFRKIIFHLNFHPKLIAINKCPFAKKVPALKEGK